MGPQVLLGLLNLAIPQIATVIIAVRHQNGSVSILATLDEADAQFEQNRKEIADWMAAHGRSAAPAK
jgi:hypothetical protein